MARFFFSLGGPQFGCGHDNYYYPTMNRTCYRSQTTTMWWHIKPVKWNSDVQGFSKLKMILVFEDIDRWERRGWPEPQSSSKWHCAHLDGNQSDISWSQMDRFQKRMRARKDNEHMANLRGMGKKCLWTVACASRLWTLATAGFKSLHRRLCSCALTV